VRLKGRGPQQLQTHYMTRAPSDDIITRYWPISAPGGNAARANGKTNELLKLADRNVTASEL